MHCAIRKNGVCELVLVLRQVNYHCCLGLSLPTCRLSLHLTWGILRTVIALVAKEAIMRDDVSIQHSHSIVLIQPQRGGKEILHLYFEHNVD
jgi:hypothetical protein